MEAEIFVNSLIEPFKDMVRIMLANNMIRLVIFLAILSKILKLFKPRIKGHIGEKSMNMLLNGLPKEYKILNDVLIKTKSGSSQIDHIVLSKYGVFVIETKTYDGWIYGGEWSKQWTQNIYGNKYYFKNPLHQNYGHIQRLKELEELKNIEFISLILFSGEATLKNNIDNVTYFGGANKWIRNYKDIIYNDEEVDFIYKTIVKNNNTDKASRREHVRNVRNRRRQRSF